MKIYWTTTIGQLHSLVSEPEVMKFIDSLRLLGFEVDKIEIGE